MDGGDDGDGWRVILLTTTYRTVLPHASSRLATSVMKKVILLVYACCGFQCCVCEIADPNSRSVPRRMKLDPVPAETGRRLFAVSGKLAFAGWWLDFN